MKSKKWLLAAFIIGLSIVALSFLNLGDNLVYFYTPAEAAQKSGELHAKDIRVGGLVSPGTVNWHAEQLALAFTITDLKGNDIAVSYAGSPPDMFKESQGVVVEGRISTDGKSMSAKRLFVKHSEEYRKPDDHSQMNAEYLQKSLFKNELQAPVKN